MCILPFLPNLVRSMGDPLTPLPCSWPICLPCIFLLSNKVPGSFLALFTRFWWLNMKLSILVPFGHPHVRPLDPTARKMEILHWNFLEWLPHTDRLPREKEFYGTMNFILVPLWHSNFQFPVHLVIIPKNLSLTFYGAPVINRFIHILFSKQRETQTQAMGIKSDALITTLVFSKWQLTFTGWISFAKTLFLHFSLQSCTTSLSSTFGSMRTGIHGS